MPVAVLFAFATDDFSEAVLLFLGRDQGTSKAPSHSPSSSPSGVQSVLQDWFGFCALSDATKAQANQFTTGLRYSLCSLPNSNNVDATTFSGFNRRARVHAQTLSFPFLESASFYCLHASYVLPLVNNATPFSLILFVVQVVHGQTIRLIHLHATRDLLVTLVNSFCVSFVSLLRYEGDPGTQSDTLVDYTGGRSWWRLKLR